ncbi:hypothetical protein ADUPG1_003321, partial [Aduncisulcus paluster]
MLNIVNGGMMFVESLESSYPHDSGIEVEQIDNAIVLRYESDLTGVYFSESGDGKNWNFDFSFTPSQQVLDQPLVSNITCSIDFIPIEEFTSNRLFEAKVTFDTVSLTYTDCTQSAKSYSNNGVCEMCENATKGGIGATVCTDCTLRELCTPTTYSTISSSELYTVSIITSSSMTSSSAVFNVEFQVDDVAKSSLDPGDVVTV